MDTFRLLILCALVLLAQGHRYTPQGVSGGSCSDLPVDVHTAVKQRIEELKGRSVCTTNTEIVPVEIEQVLL